MPDYSMFYQNFTDPMFQSSMMPGTSTSSPSIQQVPPPPQASALPQRKRRTDQRKFLALENFVAFKKIRVFCS